MSKYIIEWGSQSQTKTGKTVFNATFKDEQGLQHEKVSIWSDFPGFADIRPGTEVEGEIVKGKTGYLSLYPPRKLEPPKFVQRERAMNEAMAKKETSISKFQANKEESIRLSSSARDATLIVTTFYPELATNESKEEIIKRVWNEWRNYFASSFDQAPPF